MAPSWNEADGIGYGGAIERLITAVQNNSVELARELAPLLAARHPSQLYQAVAEGPVLLFAMALAVVSVRMLGATGLAVAFAGDYLTTFIDVPPALAAPVFLVLVALLNARGIKESVRSNLVMTAVEFGGLVLVVVLAGIALSGGTGDLSRATQAPESGVAGAVLGAAMLAFYSFVGFETSANVAEEVQDVSRVYPRALFAALGATGLIYVLVALASVAMVPVDELGESSGPLLTVVEATGVGLPSWLFSLIALIAVANGALLSSIMSSRLVYGMAEEGLLPAVLGRVLPNRRTPWVAILVTATLSIILSVVGTLAMLAETVVLFLLFVFLSTNIAVLVLRKDDVDHEHFRTPRALPVLAVVSCLVLLTQAALQVWLLAGVLLVLGTGLYALQRRSAGVSTTRRR